MRCFPFSVSFFFHIETMGDKVYEILKEDENYSIRNIINIKGLRLQIFSDLFMYSLVLKLHIHRKI